jgi:hypothetical protein
MLTSPEKSAHLNHPNSSAELKHCGKKAPLHGFPTCGITRWFDNGGPLLQVEEH